VVKTNLFRRCLTSTEPSLLLSGEFLVLLFRDKRTNKRRCLCDHKCLFLIRNTPCICRRASPTCFGTKERIKDVVYATPTVCLLRVFPVHLPSGFPDHRSDETPLYVQRKAYRSTPFFLIPFYQYLYFFLLTTRKNTVIATAATSAAIIENHMPSSSKNKGNISTANT